MTVAARRKVVALIFLACVSVLWLILPGAAEAQNRRRDREKRITEDAATIKTPPIPSANAIAAAATTAPTAPTAPAAPVPRPDAPKSSGRSRSSPAAAPAVAPSNASRTAYNDHFSLLGQKNIFLANRPSMTKSNNSRPTPPRSNNSTPARAAEESLVLTGIILEVDRPIAFIENESTGVTQRLTLGDPIAHGGITRIELDFLEYESDDGNVTRVEIGRTFTGEAPAAPSIAAAPMGTSATNPASPPGRPADGEGDSEDEDAPPRPAAPPQPPTVAPAAGDPSKGNLSIEEKMKLKRLQELKK